MRTWMMRWTVGNDVAEHPARAIDLPLLALEQGDLLAELADAGEVEAEVRLDRLLAEHRAATAIGR